MWTHWKLKLATETNANGNPAFDEELISVGCLTFWMLGRPLYSTTFLWRMFLCMVLFGLCIVEGESRAVYKTEERKCQEEKPQRGERRCDRRRGEKSRGRGRGDAKRKCENPPISFVFTIDYFFCYSLDPPHALHTHVCLSHCFQHRVHESDTTRS